MCVRVCTGKCLERPDCLLSNSCEMLQVEEKSKRSQVSYRTGNLYLPRKQTVMFSAVWSCWTGSRYFSGGSLSASRFVQFQNPVSTGAVFTVPGEQKPAKMRTPISRAAAHSYLCSFNGSSQDSGGMDRREVKRNRRAGVAPYMSKGGMFTAGAYNSWWVSSLP